MWSTALKNSMQNCNRGESMRREAERTQQEQKEQMKKWQGQGQGQSRDGGKD